VRAGLAQRARIVLLAADGVSNRRLHRLCPKGPVIEVTEALRQAHGDGLSLDGAPSASVIDRAEQLTRGP
jgi:hypothetical protein